ncbi:MAG: A/G-specific adenine glycosylase, partial [Candidatus Zixiibacteriota bacterium]
MKKLLSPALVRRFRRKVLSFYRRHGRDLPFRHTRDPYHITVCEVMLHQTQVDRVLPRYRAWVRRWPNWRALASARKQDVLAAWSGLGYNRRALYLRDIAHIVVNDYGGQLPDDYHALCRLPGIGPYTANAILIFAFNRRA